MVGLKKFIEDLTDVRYGCFGSPKHAHYSYKIDEWIEGLKKFMEANKYEEVSGLVEISEVLKYVDGKAV